MFRRHKSVHCPLSTLRRLMQYRLSYGTICWVWPYASYSNATFCVRHYMRLLCWIEWSISTWSTTNRLHARAHPFRFRDPTASQRVNDPYSNVPNKDSANIRNHSIRYTWCSKSTTNPFTREWIICVFGFGSVHKPHFLQTHIFRDTYTHTQHINHVHLTRRHHRILLSDRKWFIFIYCFYIYFSSFIGRGQTTV